MSKANSHGKLVKVSERLSDPQALLEARVNTPETECTNKPIFFYEPNEDPYGVFSQWYECKFTVSKLSLSYLNRVMEPRRRTKSEEIKPLSTMSKFVSVTVTELPSSKISPMTPARGSWSKPQLGNQPVRRQRDSLLTFNCVEQYIMYCKAYYFHDYFAAGQILCAKDPQEQRKHHWLTGGHDERRWAKIRFHVAEEGNYAKFSQNEKLKELLVETEEKLLCEAAPYDNIWGVDINKATATKNWEKLLGPETMFSETWGMNLFGKSIMRVRERIREEGRISDEEKAIAEEKIKEKERIKEEEEERLREEERVIEEWGSQEEKTKAEEKRIRKLKKKLRGIETLKKKREAGDFMEDTQNMKIATEEKVKKELEKLGVLEEILIELTAESLGWMNFTPG
jgi:ribA/ribD-fused uncharacterized protein